MRLDNKESNCLFLFFEILFSFDIEFDVILNHENK